MIYKNRKIISLLLLIPVLGISLIGISYNNPNAETLDLSQTSGFTLILEIPEIKGYSNVQVAKDGHDLLSYTFSGFSEQVLGVGGSRSKSSGVALTEVSVLKIGDGASAAFFNAFINGEIFPEVIITHYFSGEGQFKTFSKLTLKDASIIVYSYGAIGTDLFESFSFGYSSIMFETTHFDSQGNSIGTAVAEYNVDKGEA